MRNLLGGTYFHNVDDKGRVIMPVKFKRELGSEFIITAGYDKTLMVMSYEDWGKFLARFENAPPSKVRWIKRYFLSHMTEVSTDKQGRMQIPQLLRQKLGIEDEAVLVGNGDMVEIWTPQEWEASQKMFDSDAIIASMDELIV